MARGGGWGALKKRYGRENRSVMQHASHSLISDLAALSLVSNLTRYPFSISAELLTFVRKKKKALEGQQEERKYVV